MRRFDTYGFEFRGTLWESARVVLDATSPNLHQDAASIVTGNPSVHPPPAILALMSWPGSISTSMRNEDGTIRLVFTCRLPDVVSRVDVAEAS